MKNGQTVKAKEGNTSITGGKALTTIPPLRNHLDGTDPECALAYVNMAALYVLNVTLRIPRATLILVFFKLVLLELSLSFCVWA